MVFLHGGSSFVSSSTECRFFGDGFSQFKRPPLVSGFVGVLKEPANNYFMHSWEDFPTNLKSILFTHSSDLFLTFPTAGATGCQERQSVGLRRAKAL